MPYSINIRSEDPTSKAIYALWELCSELEDEASMASLGYPPHLTFAVFDEAEEDGLAALVDALSRALVSPTIRFDGIGYFENPHSIVLWAALANPGLLYDIHAHVHEMIGSSVCRPIYRPGNWTPHCSLAINVPFARLEAAKVITRTKIAPFDVVFDVVDCAQFHPIEVIHERRLTSKA